MADIIFPFEEEDSIPPSPEEVELPIGEPYELTINQGGVPPEPELPAPDELLYPSILGESVNWRSDEETDHHANVARFMDRSDLDALAQDVVDWVGQDRQSRRQWEKREAEGIKRLGVTDEIVGSIKSVDPHADWAATAVHPGLQKACIQFWARAYSELWPAGGPAKAVVLGASTPERQEQAGRVAGFMNYQYTEKMPNAAKEMSAMLYRLPLSGSVFKKNFFDPSFSTLTTRFVESNDFVKPYSASDLRTAPRYTHVSRMTRNEFNKLVALGVYLNVLRQRPDDEQQEHQEIDRVIDDATGQTPMTDYGENDAEFDSRDIFYECSAILDLGERNYFDPLANEVWTDPETGDLVPSEEVDENYHERVGIGVPYLVVVNKTEECVVAIRRHWREGDVNYERRQDVVEYQFLPGLGGYGFGLLHIAGGLTDAQTGLLRYLLDGSALDTVGRLSGFVSQDAVGMGNLPPFQMGKMQRIPGNAEDWKKQIWTPDFQWRANNVLESIQYLDGLLEFLVASTESMIGDANKDMPVGTILARIEQGTKPFAAIFGLLHQTLREEMRSLAELAVDYMPPRYPYAVEGEDREVFASDFDDRVDVTPVSDPNVVSGTQRMVQGEAVLRGARENIDVLGPEVLIQAWENYLTTLRVPDHERFLPQPQPDAPTVDPLEEEEARKDEMMNRDQARKDAAAGAEIKRRALTQGMENDSELRGMGDAAIQAEEVGNEVEQTAARVLDMAMARRQQLANEAGAGVPA